MAENKSGEPLGDTGITWGKSDDGSRTWWSSSDGSGHSTTTKDGDVVHFHTHSPNDAKPNGWESNVSTGEDTPIHDGKKQ